MGKRIIGLISGVVLGAAVASISPPSGLSPEAMHALGIIVWAIACWIFAVAPDYVIALAMCTLWVLFKCVPFKTAFATFADNTWWLLLGAIGLGVAIAKSGLLKRISLRVMNIFPTNFKGQALGLISAGFILAPLIPSMTAKAAIVAPISMGISDAMGYERKSRGAAGLFAAMYLGFVLTGPMFISASFVGYMIRGLLPPDVQAQFNWTMWFAAGSVWAAGVLGLTYMAICILYSPTERNSISADHASVELQKLGPMGRNEKTSAAVLTAALACWMTEPLHGINSTVIAVSGMLVLLAFNIFDRVDFRSEMGWDNIIFIGCIINMGNVLPALKIDTWLAGVAGPLIVPILSNMYMFVIVMALTIYAIRFVLVSFTATTAIFTVLLTPFALQAHINPWTTAFVVYVSTGIWSAFYQNSTFITAFYAVKGEMVTHRQMAPLSYAYCLISALALLLSIPLWQYLDLLPRS